MPCTIVYTVGMGTDYRFQPKGLKSSEGWYDRGYIPHFEAGETHQFLTFRLFDSMPQVLLDKWRKQAEGKDERSQVIYRKRIEEYLDRGHGDCFLRDKRVAEMTQNALLFHNSSKYALSSWVIMPNHLHFLAKPFEGVELSEIAHSIKSYTAHEANKILGRTGQFWQPEPFDRYIRNYEHFNNVRKYIENNPVKARLCKKPEDWIYSSASFRNKIR